jgi:hypothetical protein
MGDIYKQAGQVIIWLGDGPTSDSTELCCGSARRFINTKTTKNPKIILQHQYFTRLWIAQEVLSARYIAVFVHDVFISWLDMVPVVGKLSDEVSEESMYTGYELFCMSSPNQQLWGLMRGGLYMVIAFSCLECVDPRDKVYGVLGLIDLGKHHIVIDYNKFVNQIYADMLIAAFSACMDLALPQDQGVLDEYTDGFEILFVNMGGQDAHGVSLKRFLRAIWNEESIYSFVEQFSPIDMMGFEYASEAVPKDRWWYDFQGVTYYVECDSSEWTLEHHRPLLVDWKEYISTVSDEGIAT